MSAGTEKKEQSFVRKWLTLLILALALFVAGFSFTSPGKAFWQHLFGVSGFAPREDTPFSIHVLDVGKADAILIRCEGHAALVDAGDPLDGEAVVDYLYRCGVKELDYVISSHPDKDHAGGLAQVLREVHVGKLIRSGCFGERYEEIDAVAEEKQIPRQIVSPGDRITLGSARMEILGPLKEYENTNDSSLVFRLEYIEFSALFCGDVEEKAELDLVKFGADLSADLLKVPHHGSKTSSTKRFLKAVRPRYAVISVGHDKNDLPDEKALVRLRDAGISETYRTDVDGTVIFRYDGKQISVETEH